MPDSLESMCAYCGAPATTRDHIPPKSLFALPAPVNLLTVPSCEGCNRGASNDDEYFRDTVLKYHRVTEHPEAQRQLEAMFRAAANPKKHGYTKARLNDFTTVDAVSPAGVHLGKLPAYRVDPERIERAVRRYVRGLHFIERGARVPDDAEMIVLTDPEALLQSREEIIAVLGGPTRTIQQGVFSYSWMSPKDRADASLWLLLFFEQFGIMVYVRPQISPGGD